jgi:hypothetical protein
MPFRYRLLDEEGNDLGHFASRRQDWKPGERVSRWHGEVLEVVNVVDELEEAGFNGYIVVQPAT